MKTTILISFLQLVLFTSAHAISPVERSFIQDDNRETYRLGDEFGKHPLTAKEMDIPVVARAAGATAKVGGGTGFYLGKFNGYHVMATNHHVMPNPGTCSGMVVQFPVLHIAFPCVRYLGTWSDIDLTLFAIKVENPQQEAVLARFAGNFDFKNNLVQGQYLMTMGFGIAGNPNNRMMINYDSDCKVFSAANDYRYIADPDGINPGDYKVWSFANACDISHGDSGSAMLDRVKGKVVGIIWTGAFPKTKEAQNSKMLDQMLKTNSGAIWSQLSYGVPAKVIGAYLVKFINNTQPLPDDIKLTLEAILSN